MVAVEELVLEFQVVTVSDSYFFESICIQLAHKRAQVAVLEVQGKHVRGKVVAIEDSKGLSVSSPADGGLQFFVGQQIPGLAYKRGGSSGHRVK